MDPRRLLTLAFAGLLLSGCALLHDPDAGPKPQTPAATAPPQASPAAAVASAPFAGATMAPIPNPPEPRRAGVVRTVSAVRPEAQAPRSGAPRPRRASAVTGRSAIAAANVQARETSRADAFVGGVQVFTYDPGRVYEVWTAPLRVTTLTLAPGETIVSKAAGDTVRWQIGETTSGQGAHQRAHVMIKPLERGLETNLVLATSQRVYLIQLKSGPPETFNAAVTWDLSALLPPNPGGGETVAATAQPHVSPAGPLDARYRVSARGRRPPWIPTSVMTDGVRTFLTFPPELAAREAPALFAVGPGGEAQLVNYRQQDGLWVVDRVLDRAELRVGGRRSPVVQIEREGGRS